VRQSIYVSACHTRMSDRYGHTDEYTHIHTLELYTLIYTHTDSVHPLQIGITMFSCSVLQCVAVYYSVLQCVAVCRSVSQCVAVHTRFSQKKRRSATSKPCNERWGAGVETHSKKFHETYAPS